MPRPRNPHPYDVQVGTRIRNLREQLGWTQAQLARRSGLELSTVGHVERGQTQLRARDAQALARALGVAAANLLPVPNAETARWLEATTSAPPVEPTLRIST